MKQSLSPDGRAAAKSMVDAARFFHSRGWLMGTCGNLSVQLHRVPQRILVTPSGKDKSRLQPEDFLLVDERGQTLDRSGKASEELTVHQEIYRLTEASAVFHVHSISNNLASRLWLDAGQVVLEGIEMIKGLAGKTLHDRVHLPIVANSQDMRSLADSVAAGVSPECPAVLVYQHGIYVWGQNAETARRHVEIFEFLLEYAVKLHGFGLSSSDNQGRGIV
ncbi:methylthioribulose 1-phosphate dehydratase [bacterium]|nr:methylthioribulose 1-phosphate dehydratase [bacterium]